MCTIVLHAFYGVCLTTVGRQKLCYVHVLFHIQACQLNLLGTGIFVTLKSVQRICTCIFPPHTHTAVYLGLVLGVGL